MPTLRSHPSATPTQHFGGPAEKPGPAPREAGEQERGRQVSNHHFWVFPSSEPVKGRQGGHRGACRDMSIFLDGDNLPRLQLRSSSGGAGLCVPVAPSQLQMGNSQHTQAAFKKTVLFSTLRLMMSCVLPRAPAKLAAEQHYGIKQPSSSSEQ